MATHSLERIGDVGAHRGGTTRANLDCDAPRDLLRYRHGNLTFHTFILPRNGSESVDESREPSVSVGRFEVVEHREVLEVGRLEIRVELLRKRGNDQVRHLDPGVRAQVAPSERAGRLRH